MRTHRSLLAAVILLLAVAGWAPDARAGIVVETDYAGEYVRTVAVTSSTARGVRIWAAEGSLSSPNLLNPGGDENGDLWPVVAENPYDRMRPWAVWSARSSTGFDLAWSRWAPDGWTSPAWVEAACDSDSGDDLDPRLVFGPFGQSYLVWWRNVGGVGQVYFSMYLDGTWSRGELVSDPGIDSRAPSITVLTGGRIQVEFDTPLGHVVRYAFVALPDSIYDDLDPVQPKGYVPPSNPAQSSGTKY